MLGDNHRSKSARLAPKLAIFAAAVALAGTALVPMPVAGQRNARVMHRNLAQMVDDAGTIVYGRVLQVRSEPHPIYQGLQTVVVDLEIIDLLKGKSAAPYSFRQYAFDDVEVRSKLGYKVGQEVLLLMLRPHPQTGLTSPAGMEQGRFRISRDTQGNRVVANGVDNGGLFRGLDPAKDARLQSLNPAARAMLSEHRAGPIAYDQLKTVIQALVDGSSN